jgi:exodeoxyribonuclease-3
MNGFAGAGLLDSFRLMHPETVKYSWWSYRAGAREKNVGWRIDYFLISEAFVSQLQDAFILNDVFGSDHCPVGVVLA